MYPAGDMTPGVRRRAIATLLVLLSGMFAVQTNSLVAAHYAQQRYHRQVTSLSAWFLMERSRLSSRRNGRRATPRRYWVRPGRTSPLEGAYLAVKTEIKLQIDGRCERIGEHYDHEQERGQPTCYRDSGSLVNKKPRKSFLLAAFDLPRARVPLFPR